MPETPSVGAAYLYGFTDGSNHTLDVISRRVDDLRGSVDSTIDFDSGFDYAIERFLEIIGQTRK